MTVEHADRDNPLQPGRRLSPGQLAQAACLLEVTARKPGNVHRYADLPGLHFVDFLLSAMAIAEPLDRAATAGVGRAVLAAIEATRRVVSTNTNLGIVLLLAPLAAVPEYGRSRRRDRGCSGGDHGRRCPTGLSRDPPGPARRAGRGIRPGYRTRTDDHAQGRHGHGGGTRLDRPAVCQRLS